MIAIALAALLLVAPSKFEPHVSVRTVYGVATWFDASRNGAWYTRSDKMSNVNQKNAPYKFYAAAGPLMRQLAPFKWGDKPYKVRLTNIVNGKSIVAWVVDVCQCRQGKREKLIDLSPAAFRALGVELWVGVQRVRADILIPYATGAR